MPVGFPHFQIVNQNAKIPPHPLIGAWVLVVTGIGNKFWRLQSAQYNVYQLHLKLPFHLPIYC
jgi:hypothetical protein